MRSKTASGLLAALGALALAAPLRAETRVGVLGGPSFATLHVHPEESGTDFSRHAFFGAGAVVDVGLGSGPLSLCFEPMFLVKGSDFSIAPDDFLFENGLAGSFRLSYLELPVFLKFTSRGGGVRPYAMVGLSGGYLIGARARAMGMDVDAKDSFKRGDFGIGLGAGLLVPIDRASFFVEGRYTAGLVNVAKGSEPSTLKNRGIQVMAGLSFPLGHGRERKRP